MKETQCRFCRKIFEKQYNEQRFCSLICSNRFNLNNKNYIKLPKRYNKNLAEFFGILLGDGSVTRYFTKIYLNRIADKGYVPYVVNLSKRLFPNASVGCSERISEGTINIQISARDVSDFLFKIGFNPIARTVPDWIKSNEKFSTAAIRGLFDTEGTVGFKFFKGKMGNYFYKQLTFTNKNKNILKFVEASLGKLGYRPTRNPSKNIYISNKTDIERYLRSIGSHNPKLTRKLEAMKIKQFMYGGLRRMVRHQS